MRRSAGAASARRAIRTAATDATSSHGAAAPQFGPGLLEDRGELRQDVIEQQEDRADRRNDQHGRVDQRRAHARCEAAFALEQPGQPVERRRQGAARLAGPHQPDIKPREAARLGRQRRGQGAARAHLVAHLGEDCARPRSADILDDKAQCPIEILAGAQHDRKLAGDLAESGAVEPAPRAEFDLQQIAKAPAPVGRLGAQHDLPLALQALDDRGAVGGLGDAVHHLAARGYRRPAKRWHVSSPSFPDGCHDHNHDSHAGDIVHQAKASVDTAPQACDRYPARSDRC